MNKYQWVTNREESKYISCWTIYCGEVFYKPDAHKDGPYGYSCPVCGISFRSHPMFGKGQEYDFGNTEKKAVWDAMTPDQKMSQLRHYGIL